MPFLTISKEENVSRETFLPLVRSDLLVSRFLGFLGAFLCIAFCGDVYSSESENRNTVHRNTARKMKKMPCRARKKPLWLKTATTSSGWASCFWIGRCRKGRFCGRTALCKGEKPHKKVLGRCFCTKKVLFAVGGFAPRWSFAPNLGFFRQASPLRDWPTRKTDNWHFWKADFRWVALRCGKEHENRGSKFCKGLDGVFLRSRARSIRFFATFEKLRRFEPCSLQKATSCHGCTE